MNSFTEEGMRLAVSYVLAEQAFRRGAPIVSILEDSGRALRSHLQAMEDENKRLRNSYLELRSIFRANMLRAFAGKDVDAEIDKVLDAALGECRKCGAPMKPGIATGQTFNTSDEGTCSPAGPGVIIDCMKCSACGWSVSATPQEGSEAS